jgi:threonine dehydratase
MKEVDSIAESLLGGIGLDNKYTFNIVRHYVDDIVLVSEEEIENALSFTLENHHWLLEGAGVAGIAALLSNKAGGTGKTAIILSGSNCEARSLLKQLQI